MPCWQAFVDHKVVVYWVAAIAPGPLPSYVTGLAPASPGHFIKLRLAFEMAFERQLSCDVWPGQTVKRAGSRPR
jgi:hypothetical protein